jgi:hypothetical protein
VFDRVVRMLVHVEELATARHALAGVLDLVP